MKRGYIAGSLFSEAEVKQRLHEGKILRERTGEKIEWFNPIEAPCNDKSKLPTAKDIFNGDTKAIINSDFMLADLSNNDPGVMMELGIAWGLAYAHQEVTRLLERYECSSEEILKDLNRSGIKERKIDTVLSDIRIGAAHNYKGFHIPMSFNQYVVGGIESMRGKIHSSFEQSVEDIIKEV